MEILKNKELCCGCHACFNICPVGAIEMKYDSQGFLYPKINNKLCIGCQQCKKVCPVLRKPSNLKLEEIYGAYALDNKERMSSCSGGVFAVLARRVLRQQGVVFGAAYDENNLVHHVYIHKIDDLYKLKGTKYVQSRIEKTFQRAKKYLDNNRLVLFSGTPCQIAGLKNYLGRDYENLICMDLICHGVPSPMVWKKYLQEMMSNHKIVKVEFRNKSEGVSKSTINYYFDDDTVIKEKYSTSAYTKGFINNLYIRPSCTSCNFKGIKRCSDITVGDFWSAREFHPNFVDDYGVSTIIIHSEKGKGWLEEIRKELNIVDSTKEEAACWNECLIKATSRNPKMELFYNEWNDKSVQTLVEELKEDAQITKDTLFTKMKRIVKNSICSRKRNE